ncbi:MAG: hypothetical protein R2856_02825 [Caldilineaceae bacterium]
MSGQTWDGAAIHADFAARLDLAQRRTASMHSDITLQERWRCPATTATPLSNLGLVELAIFGPGGAQ